MPAAQSILVVEDETDLADLICLNLEREGFACRCAADGEQAITEIRQNRPDLIVLDRMLPGRSGDDIASQVKRTPATADVPILMLTAKGEETDQLVGFALGADDYVIKPFSIKVLIARIRAILRRGLADGVDDSVLTHGPVAIDEGRRVVTVGGRSVVLTKVEFRLLQVLVSAGGRVLSREQLIDAVLGPSVAVTDRTIDVHIASLRKKVGDAAAWIRTVRGVGYTFRDPTAE
jgi:DNA-binding response OmpR family regulator